MNTALTRAEVNEAMTPDQVTCTPSAGTLKQRAVQGSIWVILGFGAQQAIRIGGNLILTRLLFPEAFGLMAIVNALIVGLEMFTDAGLTQSVIRDERGDDPEFLNTAWTVQVVRNSAICLVTWCLAWPIAALYDKPILAPLLLFAGIPLLIRGFNSMAFATWKRHMRLGVLNLVELISLLLGLITMVIWAYFHRSVWALIVGSLVGAIVRLGLSYLVLENATIRFCWDRDAASRLFRFGRWVFVGTLFAFLGMQCDRLILGALIPLSFLGVYSVAATLTNMIRGLVSQLQGRVIFPVLSSMQSLPRDKFRAILIRKRAWMLLVAAVILSPLVVFGDLVIRFLYDARYQDAGWQLQLLSAGLWAQILILTISPALLALGCPQYLALSHGLRFVVIALGLPLGFYAAGLPAAVVVLAAASVPAYVGITVGLYRERLTAFRQDAIASVGFATLVGLMFLARYGQQLVVWQ